MLSHARICCWRNWWVDGILSFRRAGDIWRLRVVRGALHEMGLEMVVSIVGFQT